MKTNYIKSLFKRIMLLIFSIIFLFLVIYNNDNKNINILAYSQMNFNSTTNSEIVIDAKTNRILYEKNANEKKFMASTTKILTALCVIENTNIDDVVVVTKDTIGVEGSSIYLEENEELSVKDLLFGLMLRSGNDCAETLATYCSKNIENFAKLMNETALKIGAKNSNFVTPHGLHDEKHYTTAYDLAIISSYAMKNKTFREIVGTKIIKIPFTTQNTTRVLKNKNKMLFNYEGTTGIKTGYTKKAGRCLVTSCNKNDLEVIVVVLNTPNMFERTKELLDNVYNQYESKKIIESDVILDYIEINNKKIPMKLDEDIFIPIKKEELNQVNYKITKENVSLPIKKGDIIGKIDFYISNNLIFSKEIYSIISTE